MLLIGKWYVMVIAPTKDKSGNPNQVKERVINLLELDHPGVVRIFEAYEFDGYVFNIIFVSLLVISIINTI